MNSDLYLGLIFSKKVLSLFGVGLEVFIVK